MRGGGPIMGLLLMEGGFILLMRGVLLILWGVPLSMRGSLLMGGGVPLPVGVLRCE